MKRSRRKFFIFLPLILLFMFSSCAKEEVAIVSLEKIPVTTSSNAALSAFEEGMIYAHKLQRVEAAVHFKRALEADSTFALAWVNLALVSPGTAAFIAALDSAKHYAGGAGEGEKLLILGAQYGFEGKPMEQERVLKKLVEMYPGDELAHYTLGNHYYSLQQYHQAIQSFLKATEFNNEMAIVYNQLGYSQRALGNYGEAEKAFKYYIKLNAENPNAYDSYAELLMEMGRFNESISFYGKALEFDPYFVSSYIGIACDYAFLGESGKAREQLATLKEIARNHNDTRRAIFTEALTFVCEGDLESAATAIVANLELSQKTHDVGNSINDIVMLGNISLEMGRIEEALSWFTQSMELVDDSDLPQTVKGNSHILHLANLARIFAARGEFNKAHETAALFAKKVSERNNPMQILRIHRLNGIIALAEGNYQEAIEELSQANQLNPYNLYRIGLAHEALGNLEQAANFKLQAEELNVLNSMDQAIVLSKTKFAKEPA